MRFTDVDGRQLWRCPLGLLLEQSWVIELLQWAQRTGEQGMLPNAGGYYDQAAAFIEGIECVWQAQRRGEYEA